MSSETFFYFFNFSIVVFLLGGFLLFLGSRILDPGSWIQDFLIGLFITDFHIGLFITDFLIALFSTDFHIASFITDFLIASFITDTYFLFLIGICHLRLD